jgi:hypothetical protein
VRLNSKETNKMEVLVFGLIALNSVKNQIMADRVNAVGNEVRASGRWNGTSQEWDGGRYKPTATVHGFLSVRAILGRSAGIPGT